MASPQTDEQERRQQKISLERFLDSKRVWDAYRTAREGFQGVGGKKNAVRSS